MKSDIEIARSIELKKIKQVAESVDIPRDEVENYGRYIAKIPTHLIDEEKVKKSNLILVTAITATKAGIGKTTVSIGLALGLNKIGFESCGLAAAHAIHNGFTALHGDIHTLTHGEKVAYGTLTQLFLENKPREMINKFVSFYQALNLPTTLKDLKLENVSYEELLKVGKLATQDGETIHQMAADFTAEDVTDALFAVDTYVKSLNK